MKTFNQFKQELPLVEELFLEDLSSEDLYSIISEEDVSEELLEAAIVTLFARGEIELTEEALMELAALPAPQSSNIVPAKNTMPAPKSTAVGRPLPMQKSLPGSGIKDVVGGKTLSSTPNLLPSATKSAGSTLAKSGGSMKGLGIAGAAGGGYLSGKYGGKGGLSTSIVGGALSGGGLKGAAAGGLGYLGGKLSNKTPTPGIKRWDGGVQGQKSLPTQTKSAAPQSAPTKSQSENPKFSDATKGMKLTGKTFDPTKAALSAGFSSSSPEPAKKLIGPMGGAKSDSASPKKPVIAQKSVAKQASSAQKAPIQKKSLPVTKKPEADPNAGGGFVTARAYGSKSGGITSTQNRHGQGNKSTFLAPTPKKPTATGGKWM